MHICGWPAFVPCGIAGPAGGVAAVALPSQDLAGVPRGRARAVPEIRRRGGPAIDLRLGGLGPLAPQPTASAHRVFGVAGSGYRL